MDYLEQSKSALYAAQQRILNSGESTSLTNSLINSLDALIINDFSAKKVVDSGAVTRSTLFLHMSHPSFKEALDELRPLMVNRTLSRVMEISESADCDSTSLKASTYLLEAYEPDTYDSGVRRQRIANTATDWLSQLLGSRAIPQNVIEDSLESDPFKDLPEVTVIPDQSTS